MTTTPTAPISCGWPCARVAAAGHRWDPTTCWVVGDTPRDLAAARAAGVRCALVATGTFDADVLAALEPDLVLADLHDVAVLVDAAAADGSSP